MPIGTLLDHHRSKEFHGSGISDETVDAGLPTASWWSETAEESAARGVGTLDHPAGPGLAIAYPGTEPLLIRFKPDVPYHPPWYDKPAKYLSPTLAQYPKGNRLYIPPNLDRALLRAKPVRLFITEGEKKAIKMTQDGFPCVALSGVWNAATKILDDQGRETGEYALLEDFNLIDLDGAWIGIIFDSDAATNESVCLAEERLADLLGRQFADAHCVRLPAPTKEEADKFGLHGKHGPRFACDDLLVVRGPEELHQIVKSATPMGGGRTARRRREARERLTNIGEKQKADPGYIYTDLIKGDLALAREENGETWGRAAAELYKAGVGKRELKQLVDSIARNGLRLVGEQESTERTVRSCLNDPTLPELLVPDPFYLSDAGTGATKETKDGPAHLRLSLAPIYISAKLRDLSTGSEYLRLEWRQHDGDWRHVIVERGDAMDARKFVKVASLGFPVTSNDAGNFVDYFKAFEEVNHERLPVARISWHMGWQGSNQDLGYVAGRTFIQPGGNLVETDAVDKAAPETWARDTVIFRGADIGDQAKEKMVSRAGTMEGWLAAIGKVAKYPRPLLGLYASFVPPLLRILNCANFIVSYAGATTQGKTTSMRVAASVWGRPSESDEDGIIASWDNTLVGVERLLTLMNDLPVYLDETQRARNPLIIKEAIYKIGQGQGRGRGSIRGSASTAHFKTVLLSTGEAPITSYHQDGGIRVRVIETRRPPWGNDTAVTKPLIDQLEVDLMTHYGHAGPKFVAFLAGIKNEWGELRKIYADIKSNLSTKPVHNPITGAVITPGAEAGRVAAYGAAIQLAANLAHDVLGLPWKPVDPFNEIWHEVVADLADAAGDGRALEELYGWATAHQFSFFGRHGNNIDGRPLGQQWLGRWDPDENWSHLCVLTSQVREVLTKAGYNANAITRAWRDKGWTECEAGHVDTKKYRIRGDNPRMIVIHRSAIAGV